MGNRLTPVPIEENRKKEHAGEFVNKFVDSMIFYAIRVSEKENATPAELDAMARIANTVLNLDLDVHLIQ